jgi:putative DNA primase/helicase
MNRSIEDITTQLRATAGRADNPKKRAPHLVNLATVEPETPEQLDDGRLIRGKVTLLSGDAGTGKTQVALSIAANVTRGYPIFPAAYSPGSHRRDPASVLLMVNEDGMADTIRPRIDALDGDPSRVTVLRGIFQETDNGGIKEYDFDLQQLDVLEDALNDIQPLLVVIDPIQLYLGQGVDMHRANEVRAALRATTTLAEKHACTFLLIAHLNKGSGRAVYRTLGSIDFVALARSVLITGEYEGQPALAHAKANLTKRAKTLLYSLDGGALAWTGTSDATADDLTNATNDSFTNSPRGEATEFLEEHLTAGPVRADEIQRLAKCAGITLKTLQRAKKELGVVTTRVGTIGGSGHWVWNLPRTGGHVATLGANAVQDEATQDGQVTTLGGYLDS